jgi:hypothetical protein
MYNKFNMSSTVPLQSQMQSPLQSQVTLNSQERNGWSKNAPFQRRINGIDDLNKSSTTGPNLTLSTPIGSSSSSNKPPGASYNISAPGSMQNGSVWQKNKDLHGHGHGQENNNFYWQKNNNPNNKQLINLNEGNSTGTSSDGSLKRNNNFNGFNKYNNSPMGQNGYQGVYDGTQQHSTVRIQAQSHSGLQLNGGHQSGGHQSGGHQSGGQPMLYNNDNKEFKDNYYDRFKDINRELIQYIYQTIDISQYRYDVLKYENQLNKFITGTYYVSPNFNGRNSFLVFTKMRGKYYSFLVDRKQLSYTLDKVRFDEVYIHHCNVEIDISLYNGTIFDGVYIKRGQYHEFIITDVYIFKGADFRETKINHKLFEIEMYLKNINSQISFIRERINAKINLELRVNKLHDVINIRQFVNNELKQCETTHQIKGVCFYPEVSGTKLIHISDNDLNYNDDFNNRLENTTINKTTYNQNGIHFNKNGNEIDHTKTYDRQTNQIDNSNPVQPNQSMSKTTSKSQSNHIICSNIDQINKHSKTNNSENSESSESSDTCPGKIATNNRSSIIGAEQKRYQPDQFKNRVRNNSSDMKKVDGIIKRVYIAKTAEPIFAVLEMKTTKTADNYKLFAVEQIKDKGDVRLKKCQMDIAYIANMEKSKWCREITTNAPKGSVFVKCVWRDDKRKWEPLEIADVKLPSLMDDIRKNIVEMEQSDSDTGDES